jgi:hypothetical protein
MTTLAFSLNANTSALILRLRRGQRWLTKNHRAWLVGKPVDDFDFGHALDAWVSMERVMRCSRYDGCI